MKPKQTTSIKAKDELKDQPQDEKSEENDDIPNKISQGIEKKKKDSLKSRESKIEGKDNRRSEELVDSTTALTRLMVTQDVNEGIVAAIVKKTLAEEQLDQRARQVQLIQATINDWDAANIFDKVPTRKIVNAIPHIINMVRTARTELDDDLVQMLVSNVEAIPLVQESMKMFATGTEEVSYQIDCKDTLTALKHDPSSIPQTSLDMPFFSVTGQTVKGIENVADRTKMFSGLLELILQLRRQGDVYIVSPPMHMIADFSELNSGLDVIRGKNVPKSMLPHIIFGGYCHPNQWFKQEVERTIPKEEVIIGEYDNPVKIAGKDAKKKSNYGVCTDHVFASLNRVHLMEHQVHTTNAQGYVDAINLIKPPGSHVMVLTDKDVDLFEVYRPDREDIAKYVFTYLLSPQVRREQFAYLEEFVTLIRGIVQNDPTDRFTNMSTAVDTTGVFRTIQASLLGHIEGYNIKHFYQSMVMELGHVFFEPQHYKIPTSFSSLEEAVWALYLIALDALIFPNLFWTNIHVYAPSIYNAWCLLSASEFMRIMTAGFTPTYNVVRTLTRDDILQGEIPFIFTRTQTMPRNIQEYIELLKPLGELYTLNIGQAQWNPKLDVTPEFYIPGMRVDRQSFGAVPETPFSQRHAMLDQWICRFAQSYARIKTQQKIVLASISSLLTSLGTQARAFGALFHYELNVIYRIVANGPEVLLTRYRGEHAPVKNYPVGLASTTAHVSVGLPAVDVNTKLFFGIGFFSMLMLRGDKAAVDGEVTPSEMTHFQIPDPTLRYNRFIEGVQRSRQVGEAFGTLNYMLDTSDEINSPWHFLMNVFGASLKAGAAYKVLEWMLNGISLSELMYGDKKKVGDKPVFVDIRLRSPRVTYFDAHGIVRPGTTQDSSYFNHPLALMTQFDLLRMEIALYTVAGSGSPLHRFGQDIIVAKTLFDQLDPSNRHSDDVIVIEYDGVTDTFGIALVGEESKVYFLYRGTRYHTPRQAGFPLKIRIVVTNPVAINQLFWDFISLCVDAADWQVHFKNFGYLANVKSITHAMARVITARDTWKEYQTQPIGTILNVPLYDTRGDFLNNRTQVAASGYYQYVCTVDSVQRNTLVRGIHGLSLPPDFVPPSPTTWTIGRLASEEIPSYQNGLPKYKGDGINFNNFVTVYTSNAELESYPKIQFLPPRGTTL